MRANADVRNTSSVPSSLPNVHISSNTFEWNTLYYVYTRVSLRYFVEHATDINIEKTLLEMHVIFFYVFECIDSVSRYIYVYVCILNTNCAPEQES